MCCRCYVYVQGEIQYLDVACAVLCEGDDQPIAVVMQIAITGAQRYETNASYT